MLDGVAQRSPRHRTIVRAQERDLDLAISLPDLAQHPPYGLVDEVMLVAEQDRRDAKRRANSPCLIQWNVASIAFRYPIREMPPYRSDGAINPGVWGRTANR